MKYIAKVNVFYPIALAISLWLGFSGRVDWWVILLIHVVQFEIVINLDKLREG